MIAKPVTSLFMGRSQASDDMQKEAGLIRDITMGGDLKLSQTCLQMCVGSFRVRMCHVLVGPFVTCAMSRRKQSNPKPLKSKCWVSMSCLFVSVVR